MRHLNNNHLLYFWTVATEGSIARASEQLHLAPQTISGQLKLLESAVGEPLFLRAGRGLMLSETGYLVKQYADEIFSLGSELAQRVRDKQPGSTSRFNVGVVDSIPKLFAAHHDSIVEVVKTVLLVIIVRIYRSTMCNLTT